MNPTPWYVSSTGNGLSATIFGFSVIGIAQSIAYIMGVIGHPVDQNLVEQVITGGVTFVGALITFIGIVRKAVNAVAQKTA